MPYYLPTPLIPAPRVNATDIYESTASAQPDSGAMTPMPMPEMPVLNQQYQSYTPAIDQQAPGTLRQQLLDQRGEASPWADSLLNTAFNTHIPYSNDVNDTLESTLGKATGGIGAGVGGTYNVLKNGIGGVYSAEENFKSGADVGYDVGKGFSRIFPTTTGQVALELVPGIGTVPGATSFIRQGAKEGWLPATKAAFGFAKEMYDKLPDFPVEVLTKLQSSDGYVRMGIMPQGEYDDEVLKLIGASPNQSFQGRGGLDEFETSDKLVSTLEGGGKYTFEDGSYVVKEADVDGEYFQFYEPNDGRGMGYETIEEAVKHAEGSGLIGERLTHPNEDIMRQALSGEDLGTAARNLQDDIDGPGGTLGLYDKPSGLGTGGIQQLRAIIAKRGDKYILTPKGGSIYDGQSFNTLEEALTEATNRGLYPQSTKPEFVEANARIAHDLYSFQQMPVESLQTLIADETAKMFNIDDPTQSLAQWNYIRQMQAVLDARIGKPSILGDALKNIFRNMGTGNELVGETSRNAMQVLRIIGALSNLDTEHFISLENLVDLASVIGFDNAIGVLKQFTTSPYYSPISTPLVGLRDITHVMSEVVTSENSGMMSKSLKKAIAAVGINPSLAITTPEGRLIVAYQRQLIEAEGLTESAVKATWDSISTDKGRDIWQLDMNNHTKVKLSGGGTSRVPWQKVFEDPNAYNLTQQQRAAVDRFNKIIDDIETLRENNGLPSRRRDLGGRIYVPRQVESINGVEVPRFSDPNIRRSYEEILDSAAEGNIYSDPRSTLELHLKAAYREMANAQMTDQIAKYGVKPNELVPEPVRIEREKTAKALRKARREAQLEGQKAQTIYRNVVSKDIEATRREFEAARRNLVRIKGELAGRAHFKVGRTSTPISYGSRLRDANARLTATKAAYEFALDINKTVPKGKAGANRLISPSTQAVVDAATHAHNKAKLDYANAVAAINKDAHGGVRLEAFFSKPVVDAREDLFNAEKERRAAVAAYKQANPSKPGAYRTDPDWQQANQDYKNAKKVYDSTLAQAKIDYPNKIHVKEWRSKFFPEKQVKEIEEGLGQYFNDPDGLSKFIQSVVNIRRTTATAFDFAAPFIHGLPVLGRNPSVWARGTFDHYRAFLNPKVQANFARTHIDTLNEMAQYELIPSGSDFYAATEKGGGISFAAIEKPFGIGKEDTSVIGLGEKGRGIRRTGRQVARQTVGRFASAYETSILEWRTLMWEGMRSHWQGTPAELAQHIRNLTGGIDTRALGVHPSQRAWEGMWMALSPKLLRSTVALAGDLRYGPLDPRGFAALRALTSMAGVIGFGYYLVGKGLQEAGADISDQDILDGFNPLNGKRFMSYKIGSQWYGLGGTARALIQVAAGTWAAAAPEFHTNLPVVGDIGAGTEKPVHDLISSNSRENPLISFFATRGAPGATLAATVGEAVTGANLTGFEQIDGMGDLLLQTGQDSLPFTIGGAIEGDSIFGSVTSLGGLRTSPETPVEERAEEIEDVILPELIQQGIVPANVQSLDDLGFGEADAVERHLKETRPELVEAYAAWRRRFGSIYQDKQDERKTVEEAYRPAFDLLYRDLLSGKKTGGEVRTELAGLRDGLNAQIEQVYADPEFQKQAKNIEHNPMQKLADDYYKIVADYRIEQNIPEKTKLSADDWDEIEARQDAYIAKLNPVERTRFLKDQSLRDSVFDAHPIIKLKREVDTASEDYYDTPEKLRDDYLKQNPSLNVQRWVMYGTSLQTPQAVEMALNKQGVGLAGEAMQSPGFTQPVKLAGFSHRIDTDLETWNKDKDNMTKYMSLPPELKAVASDVAPLNAMLIYWGSSSTISTTAALTLVDQYMRTWPEWNNYRDYVNLYLLLPSQDSKNHVDKPHILASNPVLDARIAVWQEYQYGKEPEFKTQAARTEYYRLTGRDASKFPVIPIKD